MGSAMMEPMSKTLMVASDGSSLKNPGGAIGWAWADDQGRWMANGAVSGTNQSAELLGLVSIYLAFPNTNLHIQLDSQYTLNIADKWMWGWQRAGWRRSSGEVKNLEIVKLLHHLGLQRRQKNLQTDFQWVKGHGKDGHFPLNLTADEKCGLAARSARDAVNPYSDSAGNETSERQIKMLKHLKMDELIF